jgi:hypothetical protein
MMNLLFLNGIYQRYFISNFDIIAMVCLHQYTLSKRFILFCLTLYARLF